METSMKRRQFSLEANCLKVRTWGSWKSRHQNVGPSCLQLATKHMGEEKGSACSEWSSCYTRGAAVLRFPSPRHTNLPVKQMYSHMPCMPCCMELWHLQVGNCTQQAGSRACHGQHLMRVVSEANTSPVSLFQPRHFILILLSKALRNENHFISTS